VKNGQGRQEKKKNKNVRQGKEEPRILAYFNEKTRSDRFLLRSKDKKSSGKKKKPRKPFAEIGGSLQREKIDPPKAHEKKHDKKSRGNQFLVPLPDRKKG